MIANQDNYFRMIDDNKQRTYEGLVFGQLARCMFLGSMDLTNAGKVFIQNEAGGVREIVRDDFSNAFINSVRRLYQLMKVKMKDELSFNKKTFEEAEENFDKLLEHIHKSELFGNDDSTIVYTTIKKVGK